MSYDSRLDTLKHIENVRKWLSFFVEKLGERAWEHDGSKLGDLEKPVFDEMTPKLAGSTYGSDEYRQTLNQMQVALDHHYRENSHHPEHYANGINGMDLIDLVEMFFDWKAATERHNDGDILKSIQINKDRFHMDDQLTDILLNTARRYCVK